MDGPGRRVALFVQGCPIRCPGCQSKHLWPAGGGHETSVEEIAGRLLALGLPVTISGGEPFAQPKALAALVTELRDTDPTIHVIVYTGYTVEQLLDRGRHTPEIRETLNEADVLVDGPYVPELDHDGMQWRGSSNQRPIDLVATRATGWNEIVTLDWDTPQIISLDKYSYQIGVFGSYRWIPFTAYDAWREDWEKLQVALDTTSSVGFLSQ